jgi:hypothetical protein
MLQCYNLAFKACGFIYKVRATVRKILRDYKRRHFLLVVVLLGMASRRRWCEVCRGGSEGGSDVLHKCSGCPRRYHAECCAELKNVVDLKAGWRCPSCVAVAEEGGLNDVACHA